MKSIFLQKRLAESQMSADAGPGEVTGEVACLNHVTALQTWCQQSALELNWLYALNLKDLEIHPAC